MSCIGKKIYFVSEFKRTVFAVQNASLNVLENWAKTIGYILWHCISKMKTNKQKNVLLSLLAVDCSFKYKDSFIKEKMHLDMLLFEPVLQALSFLYEFIPMGNLICNLHRKIG